MLNLSVVFKKSAAIVEYLHEVSLIVAFSEVSDCLEVEEPVPVKGIVEDRAKMCFDQTLPVVAHRIGQTRTEQRFLRKGRSASTAKNARQETLLIVLQGNTG